MHGQLLQEFSEKVHEVARASLDEVVDGFLRTNGIVADHRMTFMERTSLRSECRRLTQFLRLVDFVVVDTLRDLVRANAAMTFDSTRQFTAVHPFTAVAFSFFHNAAL